MWLNICKNASVTWESHGSVFSSKELCTTSGDILTFISLSHSFAGTCNVQKSLSGSHPSSDWTAGIQSLRTSWQQYPAGHGCE